jgi:Flp pilus assembly pilin Flp
MAWASSLRSTAIESMKNEDGQDLTEYAVLIGVIGIVALVALLAVGLPDAFDRFANRIAACVSFDEIGDVTCNGGTFS